MNERMLSENYFIDSSHSQKYSKNGFVLLKGAMSNQHINSILEAYDQIKIQNESIASNKFLSSVSLGKDAFQIGVQTVNAICSEILPNYLDIRRCNFDLGGSILIKGKGSYLPPHQGTPLVDESKQIVSYIWMPTESVGRDNGTFMAIPGSHIWGSVQRSSQNEVWPFKDYINNLESLLEPIYVEKGDILIFDSALIHASLENVTNTPRIAANATIIPKNPEFVQYVELRLLNALYIKKYLVDRDYWTSGNYSTVLKKYKFELVRKHHSKSILRSIINHKLAELKKN